MGESEWPFSLRDVGLVREPFAAWRPAARPPARRPGSDRTAGEDGRWSTGRSRSAWGRGDRGGGLSSARSGWRQVGVAGELGAGVGTVGRADAQEVDRVAVVAAEGGRDRASTVGYPAEAGVTRRRGWPGSIDGRTSSTAIRPAAVR